MAFHDLEALSPAAVAALADTCEAVVSAEGAEPATERERWHQQQLFALLLGQPWPQQVTATVPVGLSGLITARRQRQEVMQLLTLLAFLEPRLDQAKLQVLERVATELQVDAELMADLEGVCRGHVLRAFGDFYRRTFRAMNDDGLVQGFARFILPSLGVGIDHARVQQYEALASAPSGSFGAALHAYYATTGLPCPGSRKGLPYPYLAIHDVHHVIGGYDIDVIGEQRVLAFTMGLVPEQALLIALPALLQFQMGIADPLAASVAPKLKDQLDVDVFARELARGAETTGPIRDLHWDFWSWIERPLESVRRELNVLG
ncbi:MAG: hypothetical protein KXJ49_01365 [Vulcanococcus sp.]|uniref:hypothetical protein n=1 Tax=Vulcanococcus sp. TaxID=2856995 RepID=UPI0025E3ECBC|nr:hypothetical protein [Vulcanococcus sp.]MBW0166130.1 hypothetical protein [Vulcanococcus sp.]